jgi:hypothetical protein
MIYVFKVRIYVFKVRIFVFKVRIFVFKVRIFVFKLMKSDLFKRNESVGDNGSEKNKKTNHP